MPSMFYGFPRSGVPDTAPEIACLEIAPPFAEMRQGICPSCGREGDTSETSATRARVGRHRPVYRREMHRGVAFTRCRGRVKSAGPVPNNEIYLCGTGEP